MTEDDSSAKGNTRGLASIRVLNKTLGIYDAMITVGEKIQPYLISPALCLCSYCDQIPSRDFGVNKADVGLKLVFDSFDVLVKEKQNTDGQHIQHSQHNGQHTHGQHLTSSPVGNKPLSTDTVLF